MIKNFLFLAILCGASSSWALHDICINAKYTCKALQKSDEGKELAAKLENLCDQIGKRNRKIIRDDPSRKELSALNKEIKSYEDKIDLLLPELDSVAGNDECIKEKSSIFEN